MKKIVILHTTPVTIPTLSELCKKKISGCEVVNFLDDSILPEINRDRKITEGVRYRLYSLLAMAETTKADAVLCACSSIGGVMEEGAALVRIPVVRIDEAMAREAVAAGCKIGVAATLASSLEPTSVLIEKTAAAQKKAIRIQSRLIEGAGDLLSAGQGQEYDALLARELTALLAENDVVVLAQASMARSLSVLSPELCGKFLTSPESGVENLRRILEESCADR